MNIVDIAIRRDGRSFFGFKRYKVIFQSGNGHLTLFGLSGRKATSATSDMVQRLLVAGSGWTLKIEKGEVPTNIAKVRRPGVRV